MENNEKRNVRDEINAPPKNIFSARTKLLASTHQRKKEKEHTGNLIVKGMFSPNVAM